MQNIKGYKEIEAEEFLSKNLDFDLISFKQIENYKFLNKDNSYIVKEKHADTIQYISSFKYSKPYYKYEYIVDKSSFENKFINKEHSFVTLATIENFKISNVILYNKNNEIISFLNYSYKNNNLIKTEEKDFYFIYIFSFFLFFLLLIDLMCYNKRFNKFLKSQGRKNNLNYFKDINVKTKEIKQEEKKEILIKINK